MLLELIKAMLLESDIVIVVQVIDSDDRHPIIEELECCVITDEAGGSGHEDTRH
jgi:hypothetical protein